MHGVTQRHVIRLRYVTYTYMIDPAHVNLVLVAQASIWNAQRSLLCAIVQTGQNLPMKVEECYYLCVHASVFVCYCLLQTVESTECNVHDQL